jgi:two-component system OmpR family response regulator
MKLLVIEDDFTTADYILKGLREAGHVVDHARDGHEGLMLASGGQYDIWIVDRMLPKLDGLALVKALRESGQLTPVLFLTAMDRIEDRVAGLQVGDDYLGKPFAFEELHARLRSLARRPPMQEQPTKLEVGGLVLDLMQRQAWREGEGIALQPTEFRLLECLMRHAGQIVTRTMLLERVWDFHFDPQTSVVETHISRLRAKVDKGFGHELIETVRGAGYRLRLEG